MKAKSVELTLHRWPYGLEVEASGDGLLLRPRRKARANWSKAFRHLPDSTDDLATARTMTNEFDRKEWEW